MTFSIIARDPGSGAIGVATATGSIAVGAQVPHCRHGVGAVATQGYSTNVLFARRGLPMLAEGRCAAEVAKILVAEDEGRDFRQMAVMDRQGSTAAWTGEANSGCKGHREAADLVVAGNTLSDIGVLEAMTEAYAATAGKDLASRLLGALAAGEAAGGDSRRTCSAALLLDAGKGAALNLRVDYDAFPVAALQDLQLRAQEEDYRRFLLRLPDEEAPGRY